MLTFNYHTHTRRCRHASGTEREYIETAIAGGMKTLGFSDHSPMIFPGDYDSGYRMFPEQTEEYVNTLLALREEYKDRIAIKIGYEAEYYPDLFADFLAYIRRWPCDYLILGQHFMENEMTGKYSGTPTDDPARLALYVNQTCEAMQTGLFSCFAHPDLLLFTGDDEICRREFSRLIRCSIETDTPLEINLLGIRGNRHYPQQKFWALAGEIGAKAVIGCDAHEPASVTDNASWAKAMQMIETYGLTLVEPVLKPIL